MPDRSFSRGRSRIWAALAAFGVGLAPLGVAAPAQAADDAVVETVLSVPGTPEPDGTSVTLDATLVTTAPGTPRPAVVLAHGLGGTKADSLPTARTLARDGYAVLVYTARGFGASGGFVHLDDPAYEGRDAVAMVDEAARRPEVEKTGSDPVVGFAGASYGGAVALEVAALDTRVDAVVPAFTYADLTSALVPQSRVTGGAGSLADVTASGGTGVLKAAWAALLFTGTASAGTDTSGSEEPAAGGQPTPSVCGRFAEDVCRAYVGSARTGTPSAELLALARRSSPDLSRITAPTLMIQGEDDTLFGLDQADRVMRGLPATTPAATAWVPGGHDASISVDDQLDRVTAWFDRYLKQDTSAAVQPAVSVTVPETSLVGTGGGDDDSAPRVLTAGTYPGRGSPAPAVRTLTLDGGAQTVVNPAGARPGALTNLPGSGAAGAAAAVAGYPLAVLPGQAATFTSAPVERPYDLVGSGRVRLDVSSSSDEAVLFASVWDLGPDDPQTRRPTSTVLPGRAVAPVRLTGLTPGATTTVEVALPTVSHQVPVGHRLRLVVATTDSAYAGPVDPATYSVALADPVLTLPDLGGLSASGGSRLDVPVPLVVAVALLLLAALVGLLLLRRARRAEAGGPERPDLADVPLVVEGLEKTYADGLKAVDGVTFRAERGQVVGLLGPNGAGKTTTLRMVVGLIRPDQGAVWVEGRPVQGGADVLGSVGALIEGPGFLPHLSGRANLEAYWKATGRPTEEAHLDEVLAIADLGTSVERRVRGYSQGMRQRLGIAQAMMGLPSLLLLDEPTNGLDPPQITAMRRVLADYAAAGRTVLISSHLLAEVEQSCDHVVVMARGKVLLSEATSTLTGDGRRRLEEAFLDLVGTGPAGGGQ
ncbi:ABC-2 type transport system ATP-binding protein [Microlunatus sagamiharensis]|uniref:ABC-2 type transport system ATP-binding protein n=1 Tax=Microlunatus sagamiharensis TaxID=546874 RepID=A0A1H2LUV3_9ACTN|nr:alpha/beta fold hydrolase [Microlunatus sagamiharensis]SDU84793.1 ABC-2 type transport system ATP-binding protein [Microlunatus sagamiharensis]